MPGGLARCGGNGILTKPGQSSGMGNPTTILVIYAIVGASGLFLMYLFRRYLVLAVMPPLVIIAVYIVVHGFRIHH